MSKAFTLLETILSIAVFALLAVTVSTILLRVLKGVQKSAAISSVRTEGAFVAEAMAKTIRYAVDVSSCPGSDPNSISFRARVEDPADTVYTCNNVDHYLAFNGARMTSTKVKVTRCTIICSGNQVTLGLTLEPAVGGTTGTEGAIYSFDTTILARNIP